MWSHEATRYFTPPQPSLVNTGSALVFFSASEYSVLQDLGVAGGHAAGRRLQEVHGAADQREVRPRQSGEWASRSGSQMPSLHTRPECLRWRETATPARCVLLQRIQTNSLLGCVYNKSVVNIQNAFSVKDSESHPGFRFGSALSGERVCVCFTGGRCWEVGEEVKRWADWRSDSSGTVSFHFFMMHIKK